ncbi:MAG TPA: hypothetical protein ENI98_12605 [Gammaproteobacteria bacterium]|nr:hypothetical protein [Gammaproteobacteria bacterium]
MTRHTHFYSLPFLIAGLLFLQGCQRQDSEKATEKAAATQPAPTAATSPHAREAIPKPGQIHGKVIEAIEAAGYTYVHVDTGSQKLWAAGPSTAFKKGDMIAFDSGMPMKNFHSKSLKRDFNLLYFVDAFITDSGTAAKPSASQPHSKLGDQTKATPVPDIRKAKGGQSIADIIAKKDSLANKQVKVRGKVVKFTASVLGRNWIHIKDSSTGVDLTVTSKKGTANKNDIVLIQGTLGLNKDFGYGYVYDVIIENAKVTVE